MGFLDPNNDFRFLLPTETDYKSPITEELMSQIRENIECNTMNRIYSGYRAKVVTLDSGTQITVEKVDSGDADWSPNVTATLILTFRSGAAIGQSYVIFSNTELSATSTTATVVILGTPDFPSSVLAGDEVIVFYAQTGQAHTHDGIDSAPVGGELLVASHSERVGDPGTSATFLANNDYYLFHRDALDAYRVGNHPTTYYHSESNKGLRGKLLMTREVAGNWNGDLSISLCIPKPLGGTVYTNIDDNGTVNNVTVSTDLLPATAFTLTQTTLRSIGTSLVIAINLPLWDITGLIGSGALIDGRQYPIAVKYRCTGSNASSNWNFCQLYVYATKSLV